MPEAHVRIVPLDGEVADHRRTTAGRSDIAAFPAGRVTRSTLQPGWRWSEQVGAAQGLSLCPAPHLGYVVAGRMVVVMADGTEHRYGPGDAIAVDPPHDAYVEGDEDYIGIDVAPPPPVLPVSASVLGSIGNTPLVELRRLVPEGSARVVVKVEGSNPTGSMKDRMALAAIDAAEASGALQAGRHGRRVHRRQHRDVAGARVRRPRLPTADRDLGCVQPGEARPHGRARRRCRPGAERSAADHRGPDQADDRARPGASPTTRARGGSTSSTTTTPRGATRRWATRSGRRPAGEVDAFVQSVGTAHSIHGTVAALRRHAPDIHTVAVEPAESPVLSTGRDRRPPDRGRGHRLRPAAVGPGRRQRDGHRHLGGGARHGAAAGARGGPVRRRLERGQRHRRAPPGCTPRAGTDGRDGPVRLRASSTSRPRSTAPPERHARHGVRDIATAINGTGSRPSTRPQPTMRRSRTASAMAPTRIPPPRQLDDPYASGVTMCDLDDHRAVGLADVDQIEGHAVDTGRLVDGRVTITGRARRRDTLHRTISRCRSRSRRPWSDDREDLDRRVADDVAGRRSAVGRVISEARRWHGEVSMRERRGPARCRRLLTGSPARCWPRGERHRRRSAPSPSHPAIHPAGLERHEVREVIAEIRPRSRRERGSTPSQMTLISVRRAGQPSTVYRGLSSRGDHRGDAVVVSGLGSDQVRSMKTFLVSV